jgi:hypothetical protein
VLVVRRLLTALAIAPFLISLASSLRAQSINVDFGAGTPPSDSYAAAGGAGRWNVIGVLSPYTRASLVDVSGAPIAAKIYMYGGTQLLQSDDPATSGDDAALMDDMLIGMNDPVDECLWIENLVDDDYEVLIYALTPNDPSRMCTVRVDGGTPNPTDIGGAWPGSQQRDVSYERFVAHTSSGVLAFHSGKYNGYFQSGMNGVQIRPLSTTSVGSSSGLGASRLRITPNPSGARPIVIAAASTLPPGRLELFDTAGRLLWTRPIEAGGSLRWDGRGLDGRRAPSGVLIARWSDRANRVAPITEKIVRLR